MQSKLAGLFVRRVFISYSRADIRHVWAIASALRHEGVETWLDFEDLKPGERWKDAIEAALARADLMLFCVSPNSVESAWTSVELKLALENAVPILPLIVHRVAIEALPPRSGTSKCSKWNAGRRSTPPGTWPSRCWLCWACSAGRSDGPVMILPTTDFGSASGNADCSPPRSEWPPIEPVYGTSMCAG